MFMLNQRSEKEVKTLDLGRMTPNLGLFRSGFFDIYSTFLVN